ncbi:hypothetical protein PPTG_20745 [Phytophthora nicotianae INRA-310]|uniref:Uncharacterized protein n=5 Tax=Phytophthora nicotianae TaxID=4792 RepID=W2RH74_PHYN3|nr:hypothetical protein PPTG_20745 [Phytophthora nicotianae INRA-310]ETN24009.1 hypothetical protein PPTG_20745 [Phytophthora nicotianae INRA-310]
MEGVTISLKKLCSYLSSINVMTNAVDLLQSHQLNQDLDTVSHTGIKFKSMWKECSRRFSTAEEECKLSGSHDEFWEFVTRPHMTRKEIYQFNGKPSNTVGPQDICRNVPCGSILGIS